MIGAVIYKLPIDVFIVRMCLNGSPAARAALLFHRIHNNNFSSNSHERKPEGCERTAEFIALSRHVTNVDSVFCFFQLAQ